MTNERFLGIPSIKGIVTAVVVILVFLLPAGGLYWRNGGSSTAYWLKVGDAFINGSIVGILFAILKGMIDLPKWLQERAAAKAEEAAKAKLAEARAAADGSAAVDP
jgi:hypothetical protein